MNTARNVRKDRIYPKHSGPTLANISCDFYRHLSLHRLELNCSAMSKKVSWKLQKATFEIPLPMHTDLPLEKKEKKKRIKTTSGGGKRKENNM